MKSRSPRPTREVRDRTSDSWRRACCSRGARDDHREQSEHRSQATRPRRSRCGRVVAGDAPPDPALDGLTGAIVGDSAGLPAGAHRTRDTRQRRASAGPVRSPLLAEAPLPMTRVVALLALVAACGGNPLPEWKTDPQPGPNSKRLYHLETANSSLAWQRSSYFRVDDKPQTPIYLIVADDRSACIVTPEHWTIANHGDFYPCPDKWRIPRPA